jgi:hypothetical protein
MHAALPMEKQSACGSLKRGKRRSPGRLWSHLFQSERTRNGGTALSRPRARFDICQAACISEDQTFRAVPERGRAANHRYFAEVAWESFRQLAADRIDKLVAKEAESPKELLSESIVIATTGGTPAQARLTLHLVGYQLKGGICLPLGIDELSKSRTPNHRQRVQKIAGGARQPVEARHGQHH